MVLMILFLVILWMMIEQNYLLNYNQNNIDRKTEIYFLMIMELMVLDPGYDAAANWI